jgi:hypothetical protein
MSGFASAPALAPAPAPAPKTVYYIYGRFNPPHEGHFYMMLAVLERAKAEGSMVLFLLGNGPAGKLAENPLKFELKQDIIRQYLAPAGYREGIDYKLIEVDGGKSVGSILHYLIGHDMEMGIDTKSKENERGYVGPDFEGRYTLVHVAGNKGPKEGETPGQNDEEKLRFMSVSLSKHNINIGEPFVIPPAKAEAGVPMSASIVRNDARSLSLDDFTAKYSKIYGDNTERVWTTIRNATISMSTKTKTKTVNVARKTQTASAKHETKTNGKTKNKGGNKNKTKKRKTLAHRNILRRR